MAQTVFKWCKDAIHRVISQSLTDFRAKEKLLAVYTRILRRLSERNERGLAGPNETRRKISNVAPEEIPPQLKHHHLT